MTIVLALKVGDGVVLGADSASTLIDNNDAYHNSYFNAEKLFNLAKGYPLGLVTFGLGGLAERSVSTHIKDLRAMLGDRKVPAKYLDPKSYTVAEAAEHVRSFFLNDLYIPQFKGVANSPGIGFLVAGYSAQGDSSEVWKVLIEVGGACAPPIPVVPADQPVGAFWEGQGEACYRLLYGWSPQIVDRLVTAGMTQQDAINLLNSVEPVLHPTMPIQDAVDLVDYLVEVTCGFVRFAPGPATVAKPIDTAAITKHEGFRWVHRKHYYPRDLNLPHPPGAG